MTRSTPELTVSLVLDLPLQLGEGAIWHEGECKLYFVDIQGKTLHRFDPRTGEHAVVLEGQTISGMTVQETDELLLFQDGGRISRFVDGNVIPLREPIPEDAGTRFNDVIADPRGRVFCGTMPSSDRPGHLYRLDPDGSLRTVIHDAGVSNGMDFSTDGRWFYHTNTTRETITRYPYDLETGDFPEHGGEVIIGPPTDREGKPDGMTFDATGGIWSCHWGGSAVHHFSPQGDHLQTVTIPAKNVTSIAFVGDDYRRAYITSAGGDDRDANGEFAGSVFVLDCPTAGRPPFCSRILLDG
ncbi:MAG TPA: SMP-30/gluconolactonase/LRE family protein [Thermomicrobiales bacterium]|jgi:D-xylonolactonase|nr:SMP-30/gluconolactonase/LRE family protein [Thermomicrobiales bacterium]